MQFEEFWPRYLRAHANPSTRTVHVAGMLVGVGIAVYAVALRRPALLAAALAAGYAPAWLSHLLIERNRPETFREPVLSLQADFAMVAHALRGTLGRELDGALGKAGSAAGIGPADDLYTTR
ncbi:DUF962 domain-containing protein [bacterium]|nr:MAG: DUF962 domain-containing protein [bacterium]